MKRTILNEALATAMAIAATGTENGSMNDTLSRQLEMLYPSERETFAKAVAVLARATGSVPQSSWEAEADLTILTWDISDAIAKGAPGLDLDSDAIEAALPAFIADVQARTAAAE
jgi:hypothetical protein